LAVVLTEEFDLPIVPGGSTTMRMRPRKRGLEPDDCYWIAHAPEVRGKSTIDLTTDPPPDLAIEVNVSRSSLDRMDIYEKLRVPEVWRYNAEGLTFNFLNAEGKYQVVPASTMFPLPIAPVDLLPFMQMRGQMDDNAVIKQFRGWIQGRIVAGK
jgi:Uma2 family endonuclease